jgi:hypothetical protein
MRALLVHHYDLHAHSLRYNENIGEDDGSVDEARVALNRLQGKSGCDFGAAATFKEVVFAFRLVVFGKVASGFTL